MDQFTCKHNTKYNSPFFSVLTVEYGVSRCLSYMSLVGAFWGGTFDLLHAGYGLIIKLVEKRAIPLDRVQREPVVWRLRCHLLGLQQHVDLPPDILTQQFRHIRPHQSANKAHLS